MINDDLISRSALLDLFNSKSLYAQARLDGGASRKTWLKAFEDVKQAPAVDAVEVVRCKDCRYWDKTQRPTYGNQFCFCTMMFTAENHFCAKGAKMGAEVNDDENNNHDN